MNKQRTSLWISIELLEKAKTYAQNIERSLSYIVNCLLEAWVEEYEKSKGGKIE